MNNIRYWFYVHKRKVLIGSAALIFIIILIIVSVLVRNSSPTIEDVVVNDTGNPVKVLPAKDSIVPLLPEPDWVQSNPIGLVEENLSKPTKAEEIFIATLSEEDKEKYMNLAEMANRSYAGYSEDYGDGNGNGTIICNRIEMFSTIITSMSLINGGMQVGITLPEEMGIPAQWIGAAKQGSKEVVLSKGSPLAGYTLVIPDVTEKDTIIIDLSPRVIADED